MAWERLPETPRLRNHAAAATDGERFYVFGGRGPGSGDANVLANGFANVQIFDPGTGEWVPSDGTPGSPPPLSQARCGMGKAVFLDGEFWIMGGETPVGCVRDHLAEGWSTRPAGWYDQKSSERPQCSSSGRDASRYRA